VESKPGEEGETHKPRKNQVKSIGAYSVASSRTGGSNRSPPAAGTGVYLERRKDQRMVLASLAMTKGEKGILEGDKRELVRGGERWWE
jgi:hypothetical protein